MNMGFGNETAIPQTPINVEANVKFGSPQQNKRNVPPPAARQEPKKVSPIKANKTGIIQAYADDKPDDMMTDESPVPYRRNIGADF